MHNAQLHHIATTQLEIVLYWIFIGCLNCQITHSSCIKESILSEVRAHPTEKHQTFQKVHVVTLTQGWGGEAWTSSGAEKKRQCNFFRNYRIQYHLYYPKSLWEDVHVLGINKSTFSRRNVCNVHHTAFCMTASNGGRHGSGLEKSWISFFPVPRARPGRFSRGRSSIFTNGRSTAVQPVHTFQKFFTKSRCCFYANWKPQSYTPDPCSSKAS